jgi:DNA-3-methyladenine glycosylase II
MCANMDESPFDAPAGVTYGTNTSTDERIRSRMTPSAIDRSIDPRAYLSLGRQEPVFSRLIAIYGHPAPFDWHDGGRTGASQFAAMLLHIVGQQISAAAAFQIYDRVAAACGGIPTATAILAVGASALRGTGLSSAKVAYVLALAEAQSNGVIDIEGMTDRDDAAIIAELTAIRGIGLWSAQTFLIHNLARPDVLPAADLGIRRAIAAHWRLDDLPSPNEVQALAAAWAPYRSYAAALLWRSLAPANEESDPKARALQAETEASTSASPGKRHR